MSHWHNGSLPLDSIEELEAGCAAVGIRTVRDSLAKGYGGARTRGALVIRGDRGGDIAVNPLKGGGLKTTADEMYFTNGHVAWLQKKGVFAQATASKLMKDAPKGLKWSAVVEQDGAVKIEIDSPAAGRKAWGG